MRQIIIANIAMVNGHQLQTVVTWVLDEIERNPKKRKITSNRYAYLKGKNWRTNELALVDHLHFEKLITS